MNTKNTLSWISAAGGMSGAALCSTGFLAIGYPAFLLGSLLAMFVLRSNKPMLLQFTFFTICNIMGLLKFTFEVI